jgi:NYN domain
MTLVPTASLAVLIDGDNLAGSHADALFRQIAALGTTSVRRLYGDFQNGRMKDWVAAMDKHGIVAVHVQPTGGKNGTDMAVAIDAMDLLHTTRPEIFCIVTSDRDYTRLILRLREAGCIIHGFGEAKAPDSLANASNHFHRLKSSPSPVAQLSSAKTSPAVSKAAATPPKMAPVTKQPHRAQPWIEAILADANNRWMGLGELGKLLRAEGHDVQKATGYKQLKQLLTALNTVFEQRSDPASGAPQVRHRKA